MPNLIQRVAQKRSRTAALFLFLASLVVGVPLLQVSQHALASNPGIGVTVTVTAESSGEIPVKEGSLIAQDMVVCVGHRVTFTAKGIPGGGTCRWEAVGAGANPAQGPHGWTVPAGMEGSKSMAVTFDRPGIYTAKVTYTHPDCEPPSSVAEVSVLVADDKLKKNGEYVPPADDDDPGNDTYAPWGCPPPPPPPPYEEGDPCVCELHLTVLRFICVNDDDDQPVDSAYYEEWDWNHAPSPMDDDLRPVTVAVNTNKPGTLTLSIVRGGDFIGGKFWKDAEKYEVAQTSWRVEAGGTSGRPFTVFIEGVKHSLEKEDVELKLSFVCDEESGSSGGNGGENGSGGGCDPVMKKTTVYQIDLDVDSDNQNGFEFAGFTGAEDKIEDSDKEIEEGCQRPGKVVVLTSRKNTDNDDVPDYADGFNLEGADSGEGADELANVTDGLKFVPVQVELKEPFDPGSAKIRFTYGPVSKPELSDEGIERTGAGTGEDPYMFAIKKGGLRLWKKKPTARASGKAVSAGDFIPADMELDWSDIVGESGARIAKLYLEYVDKAVPEAGGRRKIAARVTEGEAECEDRANVTLLPVEVVELAPKLVDESDNEIEGSEKPLPAPKTSVMVEVDPVQNRIAHREIKIRIGNGNALEGKKVIWSMEPLFSQPATVENPGPHPAIFRGDWAQAAEAHRDRFEASTIYGANGFERISQEQGRTTVDAGGFSAIRVNLPPIGFNKARIKIQIEGMSDDFINLIDLEVPAIVVIDPGHGGAVTVGGSSPNNATSYGTPITEADGSNRVKTAEKALVLTMGLALRDELKRLKSLSDLHLKIIMTRMIDENIGINERANIARDNGADLFVSLHCNGSTITTIHGPETWIEPIASGNVNYNEDRNFAQRMQTALDDTVPNAHAPGPAPYRGVKVGTRSGVYRDRERSLGNIANHPNSRACLMELDWITNPGIETDLISGPNAANNQAAVIAEIADKVIEDIQEQP